MKRDSISRRDFLWLSSAAAAGGLLVACQPQVVEKAVPVTQVVSVKETVQVKETVEVQKEVVITATPPPATEPVNVRMAEGSWVGPEGIKFWTDDIIGRFELENPNIKVTFENAESPDYADKMYTQAVAGDAPDVAFVWGWLAYNMMQAGQFLPIDEHFDQEYISDFYGPQERSYVFEGKRYGLPKYVATNALSYNKDICDQAGVKYPDGTWNWGQFLEACKATTKRGADGKIIQWGTYVNHTYLKQWVWMNGGEWMDGELFGTKCLLNQPKALEALQFCYDLIYGTEPVAPKPGEIPQFSWSDVFTTGKIAFSESMSWTVTNYIRQANFPWDFTELIRSPDGNQADWVSNDGYAICNCTKEPDAAVTLLRFLTSPWAETAGSRSIVGLQPSRKSVAPDWDANSLGAQAGKNVRAFSLGALYARLDPAFKDNAKVREIMDPIWDQIWVTGEMGLKEGVDLIVDRIDKYFASAS